VAAESTDVNLARVAGELLDWAERTNAPGLPDLVSALGQLGVADLNDAVARLSAHEDPEVRLVVAQALTNPQQATPPTVAALIALSTDPVDEIRSWATFALARESLAHEPGVCDALMARLSDPAQDVRAEAERGLFKDEV